jgi:hypothetical protein
MLVEPEGSGKRERASFAAQVEISQPSASPVLVGLPGHIEITPAG